MKRALISVTNKDGVVDFAKGLVELGFEIVSTGGTMKVLQENGVSCIAIDDVTGFPEMLDGRVKTLHPMVHGGSYIGVVPLLLRNIHAYRDSMQITLDPSSATYLWLRETQLREAGKYDEALEFSDRRLAESSFGTPQYALVAYQRFRLFERFHKIRKEMQESGIKVRI